MIRRVFSALLFLACPATASAFRCDSLLQGPAVRWSEIKGTDTLVCVAHEGEQPLFRAIFAQYPNSDGFRTRKTEPGVVGGLNVTWYVGAFPEALQLTSIRLAHQTRQRPLLLVVSINRIPSRELLLTKQYLRKLRIPLATEFD